MVSLFLLFPGLWRVLREIIGDHKSPMSTSTPWPGEQIPKQHTDLPSHNVPPRPFQYALHLDPAVAIQRAVP